jgi:tetratricopeptide (TPR) repeat protein
MRIILLILLICCKAEAQTSALRIADSLYAYGKYNEAVKIFDTLAQTPQVLEYKAKSYMALGNYSKAINNYELVLKETPNNQMVAFQLAKILAQTKNFEQAKAQFLNLIDLDYKNPNYHYELGLVFLELDDDFAAQSRFFSAYELERTNQKTIYQLAKYHFKKNNEKAFLNYLNEGLENDPENKSLISLKAQHSFNKKDYKSSVFQFEKLLDLNEDTQFVNEKISWCYEKLYQDKKAIQFLEKALRFEPNNTQYLFRLAQLYEREELFSKAEDYYNAALHIQDQPLDKAYISLGTVLNRQNKYKEALEAFKRADQFNPNNDYICFLIAYTKAAYYLDYKSKIAALEQFKIKFPESSFVKMADYRLSELKREEFHREK